MDNYYIGIDGGGTKSTVLISDGKNDRFLFTVGGFNYNSFTEDGIVENIEKIGKELEHREYRKEDCQGICIGTAGVTNRDAVVFIETKFRQQGYHCRMIITGDQTIALKGAFENEEGIILISGTGSICYGQDKTGRTFRAGGFGHLIDDGGSAYALGRDILHEVVMESDGRHERTILTDAVYDFLKISTVEELVSYVYDKRHSKKDIAKIAMVLGRENIKCLDKIKKLTEREAKELVNCVQAVYTKLQPENKTVSMTLAGSTLLKNDTLRECFFAEIKKQLPQIEMVKAKRDAVHGAVWMISHLSDDYYCVLK